MSKKIGGGVECFRVVVMPVAKLFREHDHWLEFAHRLNANFVEFDTVKTIGSQCLMKQVLSCGELTKLGMPKRPSIR